MSAVSLRVRKCSHKYGIEIPTSITHAKRIDQKNGNTFWTDAILKEMKNVGIAFTILVLGKKAPPGWTKASGHLVFDVKMEFMREFTSGTHLRGISGPRGHGSGHPECLPSSALI